MFHLNPKPRPPSLVGPGDARPGGRLLGDRDDAGHPLVDGGVHLLEELHGLEVLPAAVLVGRPLAVLAGVVEVEHRGDAVHAQAVGVVLLEPVDRVGVEEVAHLVAAEVEDVGAPLLVPAALGVGVLVERGAVEAGQRPLVGGEVPGDPVEDHADAGLVEPVDEALEPVGVAEARVGGEVGGDVVAPRAAERVLHHRHELDVGEAEVGDVGDQRVGDLVPRVELARVVLAPRGEVHLVGRHRLVDGLARAALLQPRLVAPLVLRLPHLRGGARRLLGVLGQGVGAVDPLAVGAADAELVLRPDAGVLDVDVPDAGPVEARHRVRRAVPTGPLAGDLDLHGVGGPDAERRAVLADLRAEHPPELLVPALPDQVQVELAGSVGVLRRGRGGPACWLRLRGLARGACSWGSS